MAIVLALIPPADTADKTSFFVQVFVGSFGFLAAGLLSSTRWPSADAGTPKPPPDPAIESGPDSEAPATHHWDTNARSLGYL